MSSQQFAQTQKLDKFCSISYETHSKKWDACMIDRVASDMAASTVSETDAWQNRPATGGKSSSHSDSTSVVNTCIT
jgi:hypothetical protein